MADTVNESLSKITDELKQSNKRFDKSIQAAQSITGLAGANSVILGSVGGAIKENLVKSTAGFGSFIDQLEQMPVFGAVSKIGKTLGGKFFSKMRQKKQDKLLADQLGISREEVVNRRLEQELLVAEKEKNDKLFDAATALGYSAEQFQILTNAKENSEMTASEVEAAREVRRDNQKLISAIEGVGDNIENSESSDEDKGVFGGILASIKGFIPAIGPLLTGLGTTLLGGLTALGSFIVLGLKKLPGLGRGAGRGIARGGRAAAGLARGGLRAVAGAAKFLPGIGLAVTAGMGIFDGLTAGIEEYKKSGKIGSAVKEGLAGAVSGLTFGFVSQETISNGMTAIGDFAKGAWDGYTTIVGDAVSGVGTVLNSAVDGFENLTGLTVPTNLTEVKDAVSNTISSAVSGFNNLTGLNVPENLSELKTAVGDGLSNAAKGFNNLTGLSLPTNLTELKDSVASTFDNIGAGFTNLTGIEVPTFDDLSAKVGAFADNMKENIAKGWESVTNMASNAWSGVKGFFGFGGDDEETVSPTENKIMSPEETAMLKQEIAEAQERIDRFDQGKNAYRGMDTQAKRQADVEKIEKLQSEITAGQGITYPTDMQFGFVGNGSERVFYKYTPDGEIEVAKNQEAASLEYTSPISSDVTPLDSPRTVEQTSMLQQSNSTAAQVARDYMQNGGSTTVVNAPQTTNNTSTSGGGGSTMIPTVMSDNSSASQAANANI